MKKTPRNFIEENVRHVREIIHRRLVCCNRRSFLRWSKDAVFKVLWSDSTAGDMYWCFLFGKKEVALQTSSFLAIYPDLAREVDATELSAEVYKTELSISSDRFYSFYIIRSWGWIRYIRWIVYPWRLTWANFISWELN